MNYERKVDSMDSLAGSTQSIYEEADNRRKRTILIVALVLTAIVLAVAWFAFGSGKAGDGAASGGVRGVQIARQIVTTFRMVPILEGIALPWVARQIEEGRLSVAEDTTAAGHAMLDELLRWAQLLPALRAPRPA